MKCYFYLAAVAGALWMPSAALAVELFTDDFDADHTTNWTVNSGPTDYTDPDGDVGGDFSSNQAKFFFDYSTVGIPSAPHSTGGTTRGLKIMANQDGDFDGISPGLTGITVSPTGQDFSTAGDYKLKFDWWANFSGPFPAGSSGSTQLSTFGIATSGAVANYAGTADGVFFASTLDGNSAADYRVYSKERVISYQIPTLNAGVADQDDLLQPIDLHANYLAKSRSNSPPPSDYNSNVVSDGADYVVWRKNLGLTGATALRTTGNGDFDTDVDQADYDLWRGQFGSIGLYNETFGPGNTAPAAQVTLFPQQTGTTVTGSAAFAWHDVEISKVGNLVSWQVDAKVLITLDLTNYKSSIGALGGGNIMFGHADTNAGASNDPLRFDLIFTLIDNVKVTTIPPGSGSSIDGGAVPEPGTIVFAGLALLLSGIGRQRR